MTAIARALVGAAFLAACARREEPAPAGEDAAPPRNDGELVITHAFADGGARSVTLRADGTLLDVSRREPRLLGRPTTASLFALAEEAFEGGPACNDAGPGARVRVTYTRAGHTRTATHAEADDGCGRALAMLERRVSALP